MSFFMSFRQLHSIRDISKQDWQRIASIDYPFIQYDYLDALEQSGAVSKETGWEPCHVIGESDGEVVALLPLYLKSHSYGEYVFDFQWANAYHQNGISYYPKLLAAIPFTPVTGRRFYTNQVELEEEIYHQLCIYLQDLMSKEAVESIHWLFPNSKETNVLSRQGGGQRLGMQYHWFNKGYESFQGFLDSCKKKHRNNIKRERRRIEQQQLTISLYEGESITPDFWKDFYQFYQLTYAKRSGHDGYLNQSYFDQIGEKMSDNILVIAAYAQTRLVAASLFFRDAQNLYGRYWGCRQEFDCLHFELCYYQAIDYCIEKGLQKFDAGAQGEHKIQRGFEPVVTYSNHWIAHQEFRKAIALFLEEEGKVVEQLVIEASALLPFKASTN